MSKKPCGVYETRTRLTVWLGMALAVIGGFAFMLLGSLAFKPEDYPRFSPLLQQFAGFFLGTGVLAVIWEFLNKRAFLEEILRKVDVSEDVQVARFLKFATHFDKVDWKRYLEGTRDLDIFFANGDGWEKLVTPDLPPFLARSDTKLRLILPDVRSERVVAAVAVRNGRTSDVQTTRLEQANLRWSESFRSSGNSKHSLIPVTIAPQYTLYIFDQVAIISLYTYSPDETAKWPFIICEKGGSLYKAMKNEFAEVLKTTASSNPAVNPIQSKPGTASPMESENVDTPKS